MKNFSMGVSGLVSSHACSIGEKTIGTPLLGMSAAPGTLATVVIGGIISSTRLTLAVLPVLYTMFNRSTAPVTATISEA